MRVSHRVPGAPALVNDVGDAVDGQQEVHGGEDEEVGQAEYYLVHLLGVYHRRIQQAYRQHKDDVMLLELEMAFADLCNPTAH